MASSWINRLVVRGPEPDVQVFAHAASSEKTKTRSRAASWIGLAAAICFFAIGCASARPRLDLGSPAPQSTTTCEVEAANAVGAQMMWAAVQEGVPATIYLVLRGAGEGAFWGAIHGGRGGQGAWIGAVVGAGLGLGIGAVAGAVRVFEARENYVKAVERCHALARPYESYMGCLTVAADARIRRLDGVDHLLARRPVVEQDGGAVGCLGHTGGP